MMAPTDLREAVCCGLCGAGRGAIVLRSYSCRSEKLTAFLHRRRPALIEVGGQIDKVHTALRLLAGLDPHDGQGNVAAERLGASPRTSPSYRTGCASRDEAGSRLLYPQQRTTAAARRNAALGQKQSYAPHKNLGEEAKLPVSIPHVVGPFIGLRSNERLAGNDREQINGSRTIGWQARAQRRFYLQSRTVKLAAATQSL